MPLLLKVDCSGVFAGLGASGIVVGFAIQSTLKDAFACVTILADRPYQVDDWICIDNVIGQAICVVFISIHRTCGAA